MGRIDRELFPRDDRLAGLLREWIIPDCRSVLDVGCGDGALLDRVPGIPFSIGLDMKAPDPASPRGRYSDYRQMDARNIGRHFEPKSIDCVVAIDVIEHLTRDEGHRLLEAMESIASKRVIVFTPNGFLAQPPAPDNLYQEHLSGWGVEDFKGRGYEVVGIRGWRPLRSQYAQIRWRPEPLWRRLSALTQRFSESRPRLAFQLLCLKNTSAV